MNACRCILLAILAALGAAGCQHQPKVEHELASELDIRQHVVGKWTTKDFEGRGPCFITFGADGEVQIQYQGLAALHATWRAQSSWLIVTPGKDESPQDSLGYWVVWHIDEHELVFRRGISIAGQPEKFTR